MPATYLDQITDPQVLFGVKQSRPITLNDAVAATLELESFKTSKPCSHKVMQVEQQAQADESKATVGAIGPSFSNQSTDELLRDILQRLERLESRVTRPNVGHISSKEGAM